MTPPINDRIVILIDALGESNNRFAKRIGTSSAVISHIVTGRNKPNIDLLYKILRSLPNVNIQWLVLGEGEMLLDSDKAPDEQPAPSDQDLEQNSSQDEKMNDGQAKPALNELAQSQEDWDQFLNLLEQMLDSQKLAHQSMEQNLSSQKEMLQWLRKFLNRK